MKASIARRTTRFQMWVDASRSIRKPRSAPRPGEAFPKLLAVDRDPDRRPLPRSRAPPPEAPSMVACQQYCSSFEWLRAASVADECCRRLLPSDGSPGHSWRTNEGPPPSFSPTIGTGFTHAPHPASSATRSRRPERVRRLRAQRQQHGADPIDHGSCSGHQEPGHHPGIARRAQIHERSLLAPPHDRRLRALSGDPDRDAPRSRQCPGYLHQRDPDGVHQRDDGRLARRPTRRRRPLTSTTLRSPARS